MKDRYRKYLRLILYLIILLSLTRLANAQNKNVSKETADGKAQKEQTMVNADNKQTSVGENAAKNKDIQQQSDKKKKKKTEEVSEVKQVNGSSPDMMKARSARPPYIVRPSGAKMPKGAGKPGGAMRTGRR